MTKKILVTILTVCLAITAMTVAVFVEDYIDDDGFVCQINDADTTFTITGYSGSSENITIPSQVDGINVVAIGDYAFANTAITSVSIPDTVESIGKSAFALCDSLTSVALSEGLERIGNNAFENCWQLSSITIPSSVTSIETCAFVGSGITSVTLSCGTTYAIDSFPENCTITISAHTYSSGVCSVCGSTDSDYVIVGSAELHDGYYTVDGVSAVYGTPDSTVTSYARYSNGTLYLNNFTYVATSGNCIDFSNDSLTIDLCNSSSTINVGNYGTYSGGDLTVTNGSLTVSAEYGICARGSITISDCTLSISTTGGEGIGAWYNFNNSNSDVTIADSTVNVTVTGDSSDDSGGIFANGNISISGSTVTAIVSGESVIGAIGSVGGNISITDESTVTAEVNAATYSGGAIITIWSGTGNITISKSEVTASSECTSSTAINYGAIYAEGDISITASEVIADGGFYLSSTNGTLTVTPATGGLMKITKKSDTETDISTIDKATVIDTSGYTYVAIIEHVHTYDYDKIDWTWTDYENVTAVVTCTDADCDHAVAVNATVESGTTPATCTDEGETVYTASAVFGTTEYTDTATVTISANGHSYESVVTAPTCTKGGYTTYTCSNCGDSYTADEAEALGHTYEFKGFTWADGYKSATATFKCANCSDEQTVDATVTVENYYGMYVYVATARYGTSGGTYSSVKTVGTVNMSGLETNSTSTSELTTEEVETEEPVEGTDTETESDEEAETNPTTGIVVAMLPMAIALAGAVASKQKLR